MIYNQQIHSQNNTIAESRGENARELSNVGEQVALGGTPKSPKVPQRPAQASSKMVAGSGDSDTPKKRRKKKLPVFVFEEELLEILKVSKHNHHKLAYLLGFYSGLRISEVLNLEPRDIDMEKGTLFVREGKGGKDRVTILPQFFREEMFELMPLIKLLKVRALQKAFMKDCNVSGVIEKKPSVHFHSLRHGFCTHAIEKEIDITRVQVLAGHSNIATTNIYTHLNPKIALEEFRRKF